MTTPEWDGFIGYVVARAGVYRDKVYAPPPGGYVPPNEIFANYFVCNVWRDLDKFTREEVRRMEGLSLRNQMRLVLLSRHSISWPTVDYLLLPDSSLEGLYEHWKWCKTEPGVEFVSNAIQMYPRPGSDRAKTVWEHYQDVMIASDWLANEFTQDYSNRLDYLDVIQRFRHIGPFKAYEIYTSMTYSEHLDMTENQMFHFGPGSVEQLEAITGITDVGKSRDAVLDFVARAKYDLEARADMWWIPSELQAGSHEKFKFTVRTFEDCLCEYRKYLNFANGRGRRRKYRGNARC